MDNITPQYLTEGGIMGRGGFGEVRRGVYIGTPVAIKSLHADDDSSKKSFLKEVRTLKGLVHPNIVSIIAYDTDRIVLELYDSSLRSISNKEEMSLVARDCMRAIYFMHNHNNSCIRHRDIKPDNILVKYDRDGRIYKAALGDFGLATTCHSKNKGGTRGFMPQILNSSDRMHDIVALAISILDAIFEEKVHGAEGVFQDLKDYPQPGNSPDSRNNTMYYAKQLLELYQIPMFKMLVLVYMPGKTEDNKTQISKDILKDWETIYDIHQVNPKITKSTMSRFLTRFKKK